jgi:hypothetical protein
MHIQTLPRLAPLHGKPRYTRPSCFRQRCSASRTPTVNIPKVIPNGGPVHSTPTPVRFKPNRATEVLADLRSVSGGCWREELLPRVGDGPRCAVLLCSGKRRVRCRMRGRQLSNARVSDVGLVDNVGWEGVKCCEGGRSMRGLDAASHCEGALDVVAAGRGRQKLDEAASNVKI